MNQEAFVAVTTTTTLLQPGSIAVPLDSFRQVAGDGETVQVVHDGSMWTVWASGTMVTQRLGADLGFEVDTTSIFADALERVFSRGIRDAVVRELGLEAKPGQPLASRLVLQAMSMAKASQQALEGVDFMTRLMCSAVSRSAGFVDACRVLGLAPEAISAQQREGIDASMGQRFSQALLQGQSPVAPALAQKWLHAELLALHARTPAAR